MKSILLAFTNRRMAIVFLTGFSSGLPLALTGSTLKAWMRNLGLDLTTIQVFSLVGLPYTLKFLWAPLMDRYVPPFLGRRRGWMLLTQVLLATFIAAIGFFNPVDSLGLVTILAVGIAFFSSSQDIAIDAYRTEILHKDEFGAGAGVNTAAYRIAMQISGALALILSAVMPWRWVYFLMAACMAVGIFASLKGPEPELQSPPPKSLREAIVEPLADFLKRAGALEVLLFLVIYKIDAALTLAISTNFLQDMGFGNATIGAVNSGVGMLATIAGGIAGGAAMVRIGIYHALWVFGIIQALAGFSFMWLAHVGQNYAVMVTAVIVENFCSGLAMAGYSAFMMSLCNKRFTATQFALLTSFMALTRYVAAAPSGWMATVLGYEYFFLICGLAGIPGLLLLLRYKNWTMPIEA